MYLKIEKRPETKDNMMNGIDMPVSECHNITMVNEKTGATMIKGNIKNLPAGDYFTEIGYSQSYPWVVIKRTPKTATLAKVNVKADPDWKPEFSDGGFVANCSNQSDQTWLFDSVNENYTKTVRLSKNGWTSKGTKFVEDLASHYYDYNF